MAKVRSKIPLNYRIVLFTVLSLSWCTGLGLYVMQRWIRVQTPFGEGYPEQLAFTRQVHGVAAFCMIFIYGYLLASHVPEGWKQRRMRGLGLTLLLMQLLMIVSGYIIYYASDPKLLVVVKYMHFVTGLSYPLILVCHIFSGALSRPRRKV